MNRRKPFVKRARFIVDPLALMASMLPPGNELHSLVISPTGMLEYQFFGIDVPKESPEETPLMALMEHSDARGNRQQWFVPAGAGARADASAVLAGQRRRDAEPA